MTPSPAPDSPKPGRLTTWCRLLRLPNLFTVPGDPLAGFMLATGGLLDWRVAGAMATSLLLYSAGLLLNDYFDREVDARERPDRPIPSGAVKAGTVLAVGLILLIAGVGLPWAMGHAGAGGVAAGIAVAVFAYDAGLKRVPWLGPLVMGCCRAGSVVLGGVFVYYPKMAPGVILAAAVAWAYTAVVTILARGEAGGAPMGKKALLPSLALGAGGVAMAPFLSASGRARFFGIVFVLIAVGATLQAGMAVQRGGAPVPPFIGRLIRAMIVVQAAWCLWPTTSETATPALLAAGALVLLRMGAEFSSRRFYGS